MFFKEQATLMELVNELAEKYAKEHTSALDDLLQEIEDYTYANHAQPHMLSGHVQGKLLSFLSHMLEPETILEIGTFTGFSAICLAEGLKTNGKLHTIELREEDAAIAEGYFNRYIAKEKIILHVGNAKAIIPTLKEEWDLVFIDADKTGYIEYYELILPSVKPGGIIIADNVLFHGQVLEETISGKNAQAIHAFNEHVKKDGRTEQVLMSVRDGLLIIKKL